MRTLPVLRAARPPVAVALLATVCGLLACGSSKPAGSQGKSDGAGATGGAGGAGVAPGTGGASGLAPEDDRLCVDSVALQAAIACADSAGRYDRCMTAFTSGFCLPEVRATLRCVIAAGGAAFTCANDNTTLAAGYCTAENNALAKCAFGLSQKAPSKR